MPEQRDSPAPPRSAYVTGLLLTNSLVNRGLSLVMLGVLAARYGLSRDLDIVLFAFTIPQLLGEVGTEVFYSTLLPGISAMRAAARYQAAWEFANRALSSSLVVLLAISAAVWFGAGVIVRTTGFGFAGDDARHAIAIIRLSASLPFLYAGTSACQAWLMAEGRVWAPTMKWSFGAVVNLVVLVVLLNMGLGVTAYVLSALVGAAAASAVVLVAYWRSRPAAAAWTHLWLSRSEWADLIRQLGPQLVVGLSPRLVRLIERAAAAGFASGAVAAITMARSVSGLALMAANAVALGLFPALSRSAARGAERFARHVRYGLVASLWLVVPMLVFLSVQRTPLIRVLFGGRAFGAEEAAKVAVLVPWLLVSVGAFGVAGILTRALYAQQRSGQAAAIHVGALVAYTPILWWLARHHGPEGIAAASAAMGVLGAAGVLSRCRYALAAPGLTWALGTAKLSAAAGLTGLACLVSNSLLPPDRLQGRWLLAAFSLGVPFLLATALVLAFALAAYPSAARQLLRLRGPASSP